MNHEEHLDSLTEERLEALLAGAVPTPAERPLAAVVSELRQVIEAPATLRARVNEAVAESKQGHSRFAWTPQWRRPLLVLAPLSAAALLAVVVVSNFEDTGTNGGQTAISQTEKSGAPGVLETAPSSADALSAPGPDLSRPQDFKATLSVEVDSVEQLSRGTVSAMRTARRLGGYLVSAEYHAGRKDGVSRLTLAVPIARVDEALVAFGSLGTIIEQNVAIEDLGQEVESLAERITRARAEVARLERELAGDSDNEVLKIQLEEARRTLLQLTDDRSQVEDRARVAQISLALAVHREAPPEPGTFEQAVNDAWDDLEKVLSVALHLLIVLSPLLVLLAVFGTWRLRSNRRRDRRLFDRP
jgi:hypothetical protein